MPHKVYFLHQLCQILNKPSYFATITLSVFCFNSFAPYFTILNSERNIKEIRTSAELNE